MHGSRPAVELLFSGLPAGEGFGLTSRRVSPPALACQLSRHANEACARQTHHLPSPGLHAMLESGLDPLLPTMAVSLRVAQ